MRLRRFNQFRAWFGGYFWAPCPLCGQMFGGHERPMGAVKIRPGDPWRGRCVCPDCTRGLRGDCQDVAE